MVAHSHELQQKQGCKHPLKVGVEPLCFQCLQVGVTAVEGYCEIEAILYNQQAD